MVWTGVICARRGRTWQARGADGKTGLHGARHGRDWSDMTWQAGLGDASTGEDWRGEAG